MAGPGHWKKPDPQLVERWEAVVPDHPAAERRKMFGYPACFVNGHYLAGLHADDIVVRLPGSIRDRFPELADAPPFDPMGTGKGMKDWVRIPDEITDDTERLRALLASAADEIAQLPPKERKRAARGR